MLKSIDNHLVPYWLAIDGYLIVEARKCLQGGITQDAHFVAEKTQYKKKTF